MGRPKGSKNKNSSKNKQEDQCKLCNCQLVDELTLRIGDKGPICKECYNMMAVHFGDMQLLELEPASSEEESSSPNDNSK